VVEEELGGEGFDLVEELGCLLGGEVCEFYDAGFEPGYFEDEGLEEEEGCEGCGSHGVSFGEGFGGVSEGVEGFDLLPDLLGCLGHFYYSASVIGDGAHAVEGEDHAGGG